MVVVALAGASKGIGSHILKAIIEDGHHTPIVLSRNSNASLASQGITVRIADYSSIPSLASALEGVHTVISTIFSTDSAAYISSELNLLSAAKSAGVERFVPSEFAFSEATNHKVDLYHPKVVVWEAVKKSGLEYTAFRNGMYLNYFASGSPKPGKEEKVFDGYPIEMNFVVNVKDGTAEIIGSGDEKVCFTRTQDIGKYVTAALGLESWPEELGMGDVKSYNEVVRLAEKVTGRKFTVTYKTIEEAEEIDKNLQETFPKLASQIKIELAKGGGYVKPVLNELTDVKAVGVEEFLEEWWGKDAE